MDLYLFNFINGFAGKWPWVDNLAVFCANYLEYFLFLILIALLVINFKKHWKMAVVSLASAAVSRFVLANIIRMVWFRSRPFIYHKVNLLFSHSNEASFPSGHASFYFALSMVVYLYSKKLGILFFIISFLIAFARVFCGVHWPSDVLFGALLGISVGWLGYKIAKKYNFV